MSNTAALQMFQQEKTRLEKENRVLQAEVLTLRQYVHLLAELYRVDQQIATIENVRDTLDQLLYNIIKVIGASDGSLSRLDPDTGELEFLLVHGGIRKQLPGYRIKSNEGVAGWVLSEGKPQIVNNPSQDWRFSLQVDQEFRFLTKSILGVPVMYRDRPIGVIQILNKQHGDFSETDVTLVSILGQVAGLALAELVLRAKAT
jgi:GAF domain-containing protein